MELKLLSFLKVHLLLLRSNRTFMELKFVSSTRPLINKNGSNRTFMELKFMSDKYINIRQSVLIVPLWN